MAKGKKQKNVSVALIAILIIMVISIILIASIGNKPLCGNNKCDNEETCTSCPQDCGPCPTTTVKITTTKVPITTTLQVTTTVLQNVTTTTMPDSCNDTDGGVKYDVKGTISGYFLGKPYSYTDYCNSDSLIEYYCLATHYWHVDYNCAYAGKKCVDGACV